MEIYLIHSDICLANIQSIYVSVNSETNRVLNRNIANQQTSLYQQNTIWNPFSDIHFNNAV
jgi:flagellar basal body rod protein FlgB